MTFGAQQLRFMVVSVVLLSGALSANAQNVDGMLTTYMNAVNANMPPNLDADAIAKFYSTDAVKGHPMGAPPNRDNPMRGRAEIQDFFAGFSKTWAAWTHVESKRTIQGKNAVWEGTAKGTHKDSGKPVSAPIAFSITFNDEGLVDEVDVYFNGALIGPQLE